MNESTTVKRVEESAEEEVMHAKRRSEEVKSISTGSSTPERTKRDKTKDSYPVIENRNIEEESMRSKEYFDSMFTPHEPFSIICYPVVTSIDSPNEDSDEEERALIARLARITKKREDALRQKEEEASKAIAKTSDASSTEATTKLHLVQHQCLPRMRK